MREIALTRGMTAVVDAEDFERLSQFSWRAYPPKKRANTWYAITGSRKTLAMHQVIMGVVKGVEIDHINSNGLDNRKANLRRVTHAQNIMNQPKIRHCKGRPPSSRYKGVKRIGSKFIAAIWLRLEGPERPGRNVSLGRFAIEEDAARAYDEAAQRHFGEFARLNFPKA